MMSKYVVRLLIASLPVLGAHRVRCADSGACSPAGRLGRSPLSRKSAEAYDAVT